MDRAEVDQDLAPGRGALAVAVGDRQDLLAAELVSADEDQDALPVVIEPAGEIDPGAPGPGRAPRASEKSPVEMPFR